ncbi:MAG: hypothetical protein MK368_01585 [SAR324 cluster bacterium]|nr:hypothetical protein [SAR324 cluster bacterium]
MLDVGTFFINSAIFCLKTGDSSSFTVTAKGNLDDDTALDIWTIDQNKNLQNIMNEITSE